MPSTILIFISRFFSIHIARQTEIESSENIRIFLLMAKLANISRFQNKSPKIIQNISFELFSMFQSYYFILADFKSYAEAQKKVEAAYRDSEGWAKMALLNTASAGKFSSDRTIQQYVDEIWHLDKVTIEE